MSRQKVASITDAHPGVGFEVALDFPPNAPPRNPLETTRLDWSAGCCSASVERSVRRLLRFSWSIFSRKPL